MQILQALSALFFDDTKIEVGMTGFEPATFCTQNKRATKLRYIPLYLLGIIIILFTIIENL